MNFEKIVISLLPIAGLLLSFFYKYKANGNISKYSGFRTALSMKSKENWNYAHKYAAKLLRIYCKCQPKIGPQLLSKSGPHIVKILTTLVLSPRGNAFYIYFIYSLTTPLYLPSYNFFL